MRNRNDNPIRLRVATYNIHKCVGLDRKVRPSRIIEVLCELDADIIALQEVLSVGGSSPEAHQADFIAGQLGLEYSMGVTRGLRGGLYGNIILSRHPIVSARTYDLSYPNREQRGCLQAVVDIGSQGPIHIYNTHFGTAYRERRRQARLLVGELENGTGGRTDTRILLGDFNDWTRGLASKLLTNHFGTGDIRFHMGRKRTYPGVLPLVHLDHIYYDRALVLEKARLHRSKASLIASDHLPLVADFRMGLSAHCP